MYTMLASSSSDAVVCATWESDHSFFIASAQGTTVHTTHITNIDALNGLCFDQAVVVELVNYTNGLNYIKKHRHLTTIFNSLSSKLKTVLDPHNILPLAVAGTTINQWLTKDSKKLQSAD